VDLRPVPLEERKAALAELLRRPHHGIAFNEHHTGDGAIIYRHACKLGCEGIVSKRLCSAYRAGPSPHWLKVKNPAAPAVKREAKEDWSALVLARSVRGRTVGYKYRPLYSKTVREVAVKVTPELLLEGDCYSSALAHFFKDDRSSLSVRHLN